MQASSKLDEDSQTVVIDELQVITEGVNCSKDPKPLRFTLIVTKTAFSLVFAQENPYCTDQ